MPRQARLVMEELGDPRGVIRMTVALADVELNDGDPVTTRAHHEEALMLLKEVQDKWWAALCLEGMAEGAESEAPPERETLRPRPASAIFTAGKASQDC